MTMIPSCTSTIVTWHWHYESVTAPAGRNSKLELQATVVQACKWKAVGTGRERSVTCFKLRTQWLSRPWAIIACAQVQHHYQKLEGWAQGPEASDRVRPWHCHWNFFRVPVRSNSSSLLDFRAVYDDDSSNTIQVLDPHSHDFLDSTRRSWPSSWCYVNRKTLCIERNIGHSCVNCHLFGTTLLYEATSYIPELLLLQFVFYIKYRFYLNYIFLWFNIILLVNKFVKNIESNKLKTVDDVRSFLDTIVEEWKMMLLINILISLNQMARPLFIYYLKSLVASEE